MQIPKPVAEGVRDGRVTVAFRRWAAPRVKVGGTQLTMAGVLTISSLTKVGGVDQLTEADAVAAGQPLVKLLKWLSESDLGDIYRIGLSYSGPDPRLALREDLPTDEELAAIGKRLARLDARSSGPWTHSILEWITVNPAVVSKELARVRGLDPATDLQPMKTDIRKLKALGLTISLDVGYEISPRGAAYLAWRARR